MTNNALRSFRFLGFLDINEPQRVIKKRCENQHPHTVLIVNFQALWPLCHAKVLLFHGKHFLRLFDRSCFWNRISVDIEPLRLELDETVSALLL